MCVIVTHACRKDDQVEHDTQLNGESGSRCGWGRGVAGFSIAMAGVCFTNLSDIYHLIWAFMVPVWTISNFISPR